MEWFNKCEYYKMEDNPPEYPDSLAEIFINKNNENDFDVKLDEFIFDKAEIKSIPFKRKQKNQPTPSRKIFAINKSPETKSIPTPCGSHTRISFDDNSLEAKNENKSPKNSENNSNKSEVAETTMLKNKAKSIVSLSERMRIKKEKTKKLLEKKQHREFFRSVFNFNFNSDKNSEFENSISSLSKKEIKMLRNRISAQKSRDRKKKEFDELKLISQNILNENHLLKKEIQNKDREITEIKEKLRKICEGYRGQNVGEEITDVDVRLTTSNDKLKFHLMAGVFAVVSIICSFSNPTNNPIEKYVIPNHISIQEDLLTDQPNCFSSTSNCGDKEVEECKEKDLDIFRITKDLDRLKAKTSLGLYNEIGSNSDFSDSFKSGYQRSKGFKLNCQTEIINDAFVNNKNNSKISTECLFGFSQGELVNIKNINYIVDQDSAIRLKSRCESYKDEINNFE
jgi:hypothetical protein